MNKEQYEELMERVNQFKNYSHEKVSNCVCVGYGLPSGRLEDEIGMKRLLYRAGSSTVGWPGTTSSSLYFIKKNVFEAAKEEFAPKQTLDERIAEAEIKLRATSQAYQALIVERQHREQKSQKEKQIVLDANAGLCSVMKSFEKMGVNCSTLMVRGCGEYENKGIYIGTQKDPRWQIVKDEEGALVLIPNE